MRTISIMAFTCLIMLWGVYFFMRDNKDQQLAQDLDAEKHEQLKPADSNTMLSEKRKRDLDQIGAVINEDTVRIDDDTKLEIKAAKVGYEAKQGLKELQAMLEQSYLDKNSSIKDIKRLQGQISEKKNKLKEDVVNTEKWDPRFVYYLMIQENYTYAEVNMIKSLAENGLNMEEVEYINELIREDAFMERIMAFKAQGDVSRTVASFQKKKKEKDDFIDDVSQGPGLEDKLIEMNYNQSEKEEMIYGRNQ